MDDSVTTSQLTDCHCSI